MLIIAELTTLKGCARLFTGGPSQS